jgi:L-alanine-DL-glutamate epimerase-like enolase superfamily enzyme
MEGLYEKYLKGKNPIDREAIMKDLYCNFSNRCPEYVVGGLLSAFDLALWDITGKAFHQPVYNLLGGRFRDKIRNYSYIYNFELPLKADHTINVWQNPERTVANALVMVENGFTAVKLDPIPRHMDNRSDGRYLNPYTPSLETYRVADRVIAALRKAVGEKVDIILGVHGQMTTSAAIRLAKIMEPYDPLWFEEPVPPENAKEMAKVSRATSIPVASGERLNTIFEFGRCIEEGAVSIVQPDLGTCGGISECKKISALAETHYAQVAPHVWGGPIITAAGIQMAAYMPNFLIHESLYKSGGFYDTLLEEPIVWKDGYFEISERPGLGYELNEEALEHYKA